MATIKFTYGASAKAGKLVWRITERTPLGAWVHLEDKAEVEGASPPTEHPELSTNGGWLVSSSDLLSGADVHEVEDNVPGDLFNRFFSPTPIDSKAPKT